MKILIVEDESSLAQDMVQFLTKEQYLCEWAEDYAAAREKILNYEYDCILLDLMLPGGDGLALLEVLKELGKQEGVIIISAKNALEDKVKGLQLGADDYLAKPFHMAELAARVGSLIRRRNFDSSNRLVQQEITIDLHAKRVLVQEKPIALTRKEYDLLLFFVSNKNRVLSKGALAEHLSGDFADMFDSHDFVYAHVKNLKKKLREAGYGGYLKTMYGAGYMWEV